MRKSEIFRLISGALMVADGMSAFGGVKPAAGKPVIDGACRGKEKGEQVLPGGHKALTGGGLVLNHPIRNELYSKV